MRSVRGRKEVRSYEDFTTFPSTPTPNPLHLIQKIYNGEHLFSMRTFENAGSAGRRLVRVSTGAVGAARASWEQAWENIVGWNGADKKVFFTAFCSWSGL